MIGILINNTGLLLAVWFRGYASYNGNDNGYTRSFFRSVQCAVCLTTGPWPLPKRVFQTVRSNALSFKLRYIFFLVSLWWLLTPSSSSSNMSEGNSYARYDQWSWPSFVLLHVGISFLFDSYISSSFTRSALLCYTFFKKISFFPTAVTLWLGMRPLGSRAAGGIESECSCLFIRNETCHVEQQISIMLDDTNKDKCRETYGLGQCFKTCVPQRGVKGSERRKCEMAEEFCWRP
jgi:hypothetical protein